MSSTTNTNTIYLDAAALESRPGRYGAPELRCPQCRAWRQELVITGTATLACWRCRRARAVVH